MCLHSSKHNDATALLGAAHASHDAVSIVTAHLSCHIAVDESSRNELSILVGGILPIWRVKAMMKNHFILSLLVLVNYS